MSKAGAAPLSVPGGLHAPSGGQPDFCNYSSGQEGSSSPKRLSHKASHICPGTKIAVGAPGESAEKIPDLDVGRVSAWPIAVG